jgi:hypothetical protein
MVQQNSVQGLDFLVVNHVRIRERQHAAPKRIPPDVPAINMRGSKPGNSTTDYVAEWNLPEDEDEEH